MAVAKLEKMQRQDETNKKQEQNHGNLERKRKIRLGFSFSTETASQVGNSALVEGFLSVWVFNGESTWNFRNGFGRKKEEEMAFFLSYTKAKAEVLK